MKQRVYVCRIDLLNIIQEINCAPKNVKKLGLLYGNPYSDTRKGWRYQLTDGKTCELLSKPMRSGVLYKTLQIILSQAY